MRDKKLVLSKNFYLRDLTVLALPKGITVVEKNQGKLLFNVCRKTFEIPIGTPVKFLIAEEVKSVLARRGYAIPSDFLIPEIFDTTNISVKERGIEYRMPLPGLAAERIVIPLSDNLSDNSRAIGAMLKIRSFHRKIINDIDQASLISWVLDKTPHHDR